MIGRLLNRWKEGKAVRAIEGALQGSGPLKEALSAVRDLVSIGSRRCVDVLCQALTHGPEAIRVEAPAALAAVHKRRHDERILKALNEAVLSEHQADKVREAAIGALAQVVRARHAGSLLEALRRPTTPLPVRAAIVRELKGLRYHEVLERLVENYLFDRKNDPHGAIRSWVVQELKALEDKEKLAKLREIAHGRRKLRYRAIRPESSDPGDLVHLMAEVDPEHSVRFFNQMMDESTRVLAAAAAKALREIRGKP